MISTGTVFFIFLGYICLLFAIAQAVERNEHIAQWLSKQPWVYALSIMVYCTSWSYFGSVGMATRSGLAFLPIFLGPTLAIAFWWLVLRKIVRIKQKHHITSIADFISARYAHSQTVAMIVTFIALLGTIPYIALQLRAVVTSFSIVTHGDSLHQEWDGIGWGVTLLLVVFTILFGARRLDPTERHQGMMAALAVESVVKLVALLAVGCFVLFGLFDGIGDLFGRLSTDQFDRLTRVGDDDLDSYVSWMTVFFISMAGILLLPRQFHVAVVENSDENHIRTAMWLVPGYLLLISLVVIPLAAAGLITGIAQESADYFILLLPLHADQQALTLLVFIGGLAAASGMIIVSTVTLATMTTNHLMVPIIDRYRLLHAVKRHLLPARWLTIVVILLVSFLFARDLTEGQLLANIGILSFCAALQFAPAVMGGLFWTRGNHLGALLGLSSGFLVWAYTLLVPLFVEAGFLPLTLMSEGLFGVHWLRPDALFGLVRFDAVTHAALISLVINSSCYILGSLLVRQRDSELEMASSYVYALSLPSAYNPQVDDAMGAIDKAEKVAEASALFGQYFSEQICRSKVRQITDGLQITDKQYVSAGQLMRFHREIERALSGSIGSAAAHKAMRLHLSYSEHENEQVSRVYAGILANLRLTPDELLQRIAYYEERDSVQRQHTQELEARVQEKEQEIRARKKAEQERGVALQLQQLLNDLLQLSMDTEPLQQQLQKALELIVTVQWLPMKPKGGIFLAEADGERLSLVAEYHLSPQIKQLCRRVNYGHCLCGRAARDETLIHAAGVDERHDNHFDGMKPHGHYVVPITSGKGLQGVLVLYLKAGHAADAAEIDLLHTIANTLGNMIERRRIEESHTTAQANLDGVINNSTAAICLKDRQGRYLMVNEQFVTLFGLQQTQILGRSDIDLFGKEAAAHFTLNDQLVLDSGESGEFEEVHPHEDNIHTFIASKFPLRDGTQNIVGVGAILTDITSRIQVEQELQQAYALMERRVEERTGALSKTLVQMEREIDERILAQNALEHEKAEQKALIEKLEEAQNQLLQAEKMAAIGQLAAGVAHEINNPVGYINSNLGSLSRYLNDIEELLQIYQSHEDSLDEQARLELGKLKQGMDFEFMLEDLGSLLAESKEGVERVSKIVKDLKDFSHIDSGEWEMADLKQCMDSTLNVVWNELKYKCEVVREYGEQPEVRCLASQINQVFMNLLVNAAHAIKERGTVTIRSGCGDDDDHMVWIEVEDTGCGMTEVQQKRVFEPFFTTKPVGKGTGLGLSLSYGIIEKHQGRIDLFSKPGQGTRFRIWLPVNGPAEEIADEIPTQTQIA